MKFRVAIIVVLVALPARADKLTPVAAPPRTARRSVAAPAPVVALAPAAPPHDSSSSSDSSSPSPGQDQFLGCAKYPADKKFKWSVRGEVGVSELAASLGQISCQPIVIATGVLQRNGKVQLEVPDLVTAPEVYRLFYAALEALGLTVDPAGGVLRIVDSGRAREIASPSLSGEPEAGDRFVVRLYRPAHAAPSELAELFGKLKSKEGDVSLFGAASLVLIDRASNVRRMEELGRALDVSEARARIYTLITHGQSPTELAGALEKILASVARHPVAADKNAKTPATTGLDNDIQALVPLDAAHLIAVVGNDAGWQRVQTIAQRIDPVGDDFAISQGHVITLANTNAEDMAATLQQVGLAGRGGTARPAGATGASGGAATGGLPFSGDVRIAADKTSNALVVFANGGDFNLVRDLVQKLDVQRRQVYVEAVILDLSIDKARTLGLSFNQGATNGTGSVTGFSANSSSGYAGSPLASFDATSVGAAAMGGGLVAGLMGSSFSFLGKSFPSFGVVIQALERSKDANVISRPHLLTMDNVKASISVGQSIPFPTASLASLASTATTGIQQTTYARSDVALKLELTPHLNESTSIRLEIAGEISDVPDGQTASGGGPTTNKRTINTAVVVRDGECVVLGGLTKESDSESIEKIPFLGDIPLLGRLFQTRSKQRVKQDLLIVLTPYIIRGPEDLRRIQERKEEERREFVERFSAFANEAQFDAHVDFRRKRGLLAEINVTAEGAERDAEALRAAERQLKPRPVEGLIAIEPVP